MDSVTLGLVAVGVGASLVTSVLAEWVRHSSWVSRHSKSDITIEFGDGTKKTIENPDDPGEVERVILEAVKESEVRGKGT